MGGFKSCRIHSKVPFQPVSELPFKYAEWILEAIHTAPISQRNSQDFRRFASIKTNIEKNKLVSQSQSLECLYFNRERASDHTRPPKSDQNERVKRSIYFHPQRRAHVLWLKLLSFGGLPNNLQARFSPLSQLYANSKSHYLPYTVITS
ncbi:hypothetical protein PGT21_003820 [Puccinia graminis f. sp. tritici]|uniref:Uncharacterized protein n=1 Tax=Puccinia graminis f. sp. tritici TaxID=56615 RepID=A0A5B0P3D4_PUCGR|nr:hypothetical protein PGT21_003820 [Puccinia graminis f. sp. tritici]